MKKKEIFLPLFFILMFIYEEFIFHLFVFEKFSWNFVYVILLSIPIGSVFYLLTNFFKSIINHILSYVLICIPIILFIANFIYYKVYISIISIYSILNGSQVFGFMNHILSIIFDNFYVILLMLLPIIIFIVLDFLKKISFERCDKVFKLLLLLGCVILQGTILLSFSIFIDDKIYSNKNVYSSIHSPLITTEKLGLSTMFRLDIQRAIFGFKEKEIEIDIPQTSTEENNDNNPSQEKEYDYNITDIDWESLIKNETDENIKAMHNYFSKQNATKQNEYTGMFKGKNLIIFVAEAFSPMAINEELTPNLYKLYKEGFQFDNFYTPLYPVSTADGEYITDTSLIPKEGVWSIYRINGNYMPYSYANVFENLGYTSQAYHNNTYTYYHRDSYIKTMGYDSYLACGNGLEKRINCRVWPQSDYQMVNTTVDDYIHDDHFLAYYMTVSGHLEYSKNDNMMVSWNWDKVKDLNLSHAAKSYIAANIEFDKAIGVLLKRLEEENRLADTVIAISGDHYPYGLTLNEINELSSYKKDDNFEKHHMSFLIWNSEIKEPIKVTKYASSLDVLPTLLNLFGIEYDSRLLMGTDIMSNAMPIVIYSNRSFITTKCRYNSLTKEIIPNGDTTCTKEEVDTINSIIYNKFKHSKLILENDYYRKLYKELGLEIRK